MSGSNLLIDTNIALYLLNGDQTVSDLLMGQDVYISFITELELLGYQDLNESDIPVIESFLESCVIVDINQTIKLKTIDIRRSYSIKLPDAIIAATASYLNMPLVSADREFEKIMDFQFIRYEVSG